MCVHTTKLTCPKCGAYRGAEEGIADYDEHGKYNGTKMRKRTGKTKLKFFVEYEIYYTCNHCGYQFTETTWELEIF